MHEIERDANMLDNEMTMALAQYLNKCRQDYANWQTSAGSSPIRDEMIREYNAGLRYEVGQKYIKIIQNNSAHSFIVLKDAGKFKRGDILKSASWASPAKNFSRGNIFGTYNVRWTGVAY